MISDWLGGGIERSVFHKNKDNKLLFDNFCSTDNLFLAWKKFCRGKRAKPDVMRYKHFLEKNIFALQDELKCGAYCHGAYQPFTVFDPKQRRIHKACVRDRIVHQAVVNIIEPFFEKNFIFDSYSCRAGKGTHAAMRRLRAFLRRASRNDSRTIYALKCDIKKFFASVDHEILLSFIKRHIGDERLLSLVSKIINSFSSSPGKGIPLGNLTSQLFANIYLHELDRYVKFVLQEKFYLRYCDDFIILGASQTSLAILAEKINVFLKEILSLRLHTDKVNISTWRQGIDFLGYVLLPGCVVLRTKTRRRMLSRVNINNLSSYLGLCSHADTYRLQQTVLNKVYLSA